MPRKSLENGIRSTILDDATKAAHQAQQLIRMAYLWQKSVGTENHIKSIAIYPPSTSRNGQWLIIGKAWSGGYKLVAFHRSDDILTALLGFLQRAVDGKLIWKHDSFDEGTLRKELPPK